jgi:hypothetical protein
VLQGKLVGEEKELDLQTMSWRRFRDSPPPPQQQQLELDKHGADAC